MYPFETVASSVHNVSRFLRRLDRLDTSDSTELLGNEMCGLLANVISSWVKSAGKCGSAIKRTSNSR